MIYNFSEIRNQNELLKEEFKHLKDEYHKPQMSKEQLDELKLTLKDAKLTNKKEYRNAKMMKYTATVAACLCALLILPNTSPTIAYAMGQLPIIGQFVEVVTFRNYKYETEGNRADVEIPEILLTAQTPSTEVQEKLEQTADEINADIQNIVDEIVERFEMQLETKEIYQDVVVKSEVLASTQDYFTIKLFCYQGSGSGYQWNYYYTIDLNSGERLQLKDIFREGADYITPISENIKEQMRIQMETDEMVVYWLNSEIEEWDFKAITDETHFYINEQGNVVIGFDEGEVAPMYMGAVEFEIPAEVLINIRK